MRDKHVRVLSVLANSRDRGTLNRRLHIYHVNFKRDREMQEYLDRVEKLTRIRR